MLRRLLDTSPSRSRGPLEHKVCQTPDVDSIGRRMILRRHTDPPLHLPHRERRVGIAHLLRAQQPPVPKAARIAPLATDVLEHGKDGVVLAREEVLLHEIQKQCHDPGPAILVTFGREVTRGPAHTSRGNPAEHAALWHFTATATAPGTHAQR